MTELGYFAVGCLGGCLLIVLGEEAVEAASLIREEWRQWRREDGNVSDNRSRASAAE